LCALGDLKPLGKYDLFRDGKRWPLFSIVAIRVTIHYQHSRQISAGEFVDLLERSTLAERRPIDNPTSIEAMLRHANLLCTAWDDSTLVGVARSLTDFEYCCYLSDLAVDQKYQRTGIGKALIRLTQSQLGERAKIILLAAPKAVDYYRRIGFEAHQSAWILPARSELR
jgi:ribosomal protein S18 acetylase RimI-like enzyme